MTLDRAPGFALRRLLLVRRRLEPPRPGAVYSDVVGTSGSLRREVGGNELIGAVGLPALVPGLPPSRGVKGGLACLGSWTAYLGGGLIDAAAVRVRLCRATAELGRGYRECLGQAV